MKMKSFVNNFLAIGICCLTASSGMALDVRPPDWRGRDGSTVQQWEFQDDTNPLAPDGLLNDNRYGTPMGTVNLFEGGYWAETVSSAPGLTGWWVAVDDIGIDIPNASIANPLKRVQVQVTYGLFGPHHGPDSVYAGVGDDVFDGSLVETVSGAGTAKTDVWEIEITPNSQLETITLDWLSGPGGFVDQVVVDTVCIPEPATVGLSLYTEIRTADPCTGGANSYYDTNWDYFQQDQDPNVVEDAIYLCPFDGDSGHKPDPGIVPDGNVDGCYSTMSMGPGGGSAIQVLGISGCDIGIDNRDTRLAVLFNLRRLKAVNSDAGAIQQAKFKFCIDSIVNWDRSPWDDYLTPTTLYITIYDANEQNFWKHPPDEPCEPNTPNTELQDEFDGDPNTEKLLDIQVDDGPYGPGTQPLTRWYLENHGPQFYEVDFTDELRQILSQDPNLKWIGFTISPSLDGEPLLLSMDAQYNWIPLGYEAAIPPTLDVEVSRFTGDLDEDGDVDLVDFALFAKQWRQSGKLLSADLCVDGIVEARDLALFCKNWLKGKE